MRANKKKISNSSQKIKYSFLKILTGSDLSRRRLPFMVAESINPGPIIWLTACGHGDEVGGIVVIQEIFKRIRKKNLLKGTLYAFPLMNPIGFETGSRHIALSKEDLNRSFPGNKNGSLAERIADKIFSTIILTNPTLVLDLHHDWRKSIPYTLIDPNPIIGNTEAYEKTKMFSKKTGFLIILDTGEVKKTLSHSLLQESIPALTLELGESDVINEKNIEYGVKSIWNILSYLEMIEPLEEEFNYSVPEIYRDRILRYSDKPLSSASGIIRFFTRPGDVVNKNQPVARIYNTFGKLQETISTVSDGIVLGYSDSSVAFPGVPVMAFGIL